MTCAELANADTARYTCAQFIGIIDSSRRKPGILRQKLGYDFNRMVVDFNLSLSERLVARRLCVVSDYPFERI